MMWFTFKGVDSRTYGVWLTEQPIIARAEKRVRFDEVPGRDGTLATYDGAYNDVETELACYIEDGNTAASVFAWLSGEGTLVLSTDPSRAYRVTTVGQMEVERVSRGLGARFLRVPLRLEPFRYHAPEAAPITISTSGGTVTNPGTYASRPRIAITGSGAFTVTVGGEFMEFENVTGGIIVDSEKMDCFTADGLSLANSLATIDEFPTLKTGANVISWTGAVTKAQITPRWRDL